MAQKHFNVWSRGATDNEWAVVVEDVPRGQAADEMHRKQAAAQKYGVDVGYKALPVDKTPADIVSYPALATETGLNATRSGVGTPKPKPVTKPPTTPTPTS